LVWTNEREHPARFALKPLASAGFVLVALAADTSGLSGAGWIVAGLVLGALGDVLLLGTSASSLLAGLVAFLASHVAYIIGFVTWGASPAIQAVTAAMAVAIGWVMLRALGPHLDPPFTVAVPLYTVVIMLMVVAAAGVIGDVPLAAIGAVLFAASDVAVAAERFVTSNPLNARIGLPLYYLGQLAIAWSLTIR
jgi:uncharacterized membrane protein YhhN